VEVSILDPGLKEGGTHHLNLNLAIREALVRQGIPVRIYGHRKIEATVARLSGAQPHFFCDLYDNAPPLSLRTLNDLIRELFRDKHKFSWVGLLNRFFAADLDRLPSDTWRAENVILFPSFSCHQLFGLADHISKQKAECLPYLACVFMFASSWTPSGRPAENDQKMFATAAQLEHKLADKLLVFAETASLASHYSRFFSRPVAVLPLPLAGATRSSLHISESRPTRVSFLGYSKTSKGFHLLPEAIEICKAKGADVDFTVQINHSRWDRRTIKAERRLRMIKGIRLLDGPLKPDEYYRELASADIVLLPHDSEKYGIQGSGMLVECVAFDRIVVAAEGTLAARYIDSGIANGEVFSPYNASELEHSLANAISNLPKYRRKSEAGRAEFRSLHSGEYYASTILERIAEITAAPL
jgi:glycosyltransferase involved in cell wall biosynthesis